MRCEQSYSLCTFQCKADWRCWVFWCHSIPTLCQKTHPDTKDTKPHLPANQGFFSVPFGGPSVAFPGVSHRATHLVSRGTLLLSTQLSWSCTDSGVVARSLGAGAGAWIWFRRLVSEFLLRELAEEWWWDREWLWGGGRGGLSVDWLWWFEGPKTEQKNESQMCLVTPLSSAFSRGHCQGKETVPLGPVGIKEWANQSSGYLRSATQKCFQSARLACWQRLYLNFKILLYGLSLEKVSSVEQPGQQPGLTIPYIYQEEIYSPRFYQGLWADEP